MCIEMQFYSINNYLKKNQLCSEIQIIPRFQLLQSAGVQKTFLKKNNYNNKAL